MSEVEIVSTELSFLNATELQALEYAASEELRFRLDDKILQVCGEKGLLPETFKLSAYSIRSSMLDLTKFDVFSKTGLDKRGFDMFSLYFHDGKYSSDQKFEMTGNINGDVSPIDVFNMFFLGVGSGKKYGVKFDVDGSEELGIAETEGITTSLSFPTDMAYNDIKITVFNFLRTVDEEEFTTPVLQAMREKYLGFNQLHDKLKKFGGELADRLDVDVPDDAVIIDYDDALFKDILIEKRDFKAKVGVSRKGMVELKYESESQNLSDIDLRRVNRDRRLVFQDVFGYKVRELDIGNYLGWIKVLIGEQGTAVFSAGCQGDKLAELFGEGETDLSKSFGETEFKSEVKKDLSVLDFKEYLIALVDSRIKLNAYIKGLKKQLNSKFEVELSYNIDKVKSMIGPSFAGEVGMDYHGDSINIKVDEGPVEWYNRLVNADAHLAEVRFNKGGYRSDQNLVLEGGHYHIKGSSAHISRIKCLADEFGVDIAGHPLLEKVLEEDGRPDNFIIERDLIFFNAAPEDFELTGDAGTCLTIKDMEVGYSAIKFKYAVKLPKDQVSKYVRHEFDGGQCDSIFKSKKGGLNVSSINSNGSTRYGFNMAHPNKNTADAFLDAAKALDLFSGQTKLGNYQGDD